MPQIKIYQCCLPYKRQLNLPVGLFLLTGFCLHSLLFIKRALREPFIPVSDVNCHTVLLALYTVLVLRLSVNQWHMFYYFNIHYTLPCFQQITVPSSGNDYKHIIARIFNKTKRTVVKYATFSRVVKGHWGEERPSRVSWVNNFYNFLQALKNSAKWCLHYFHR